MKENSAEAVERRGGGGIRSGCVYQYMDCNIIMEWVHFFIGESEGALIAAQGGL